MGMSAKGFPLRSLPQWRLTGEGRANLSQVPPETDSLMSPPKDMKVYNSSSFLGAELSVGLEPGSPVQHFSQVTPLGPKTSLRKGFPYW